MSVLWILSLIVFITFSLIEVNRFKSEGTSSEILPLETSSKDLLYIQLQNTDGKITEFADDNFNNNLFGIEMINNKKEIFAPIKIEFAKSSDNKPEIEIIRKAYSTTYLEAFEAQKSIRVKYSQNDTLLLIDPFFHLNNAQYWKFQQTTMIIYVPENYSIKFNKNSRLFWNEWNFHNYYKDMFWLDTWKVTNHGLELKK